MSSVSCKATALTFSGLMMGLLLSGCQPVRQDRSITFSKDGSAVGFEHGPEGVYVAGKEGSPPLKLFEPGPEVVAISTPLWNPKDDRVLFTTARRKDGATPPRRLSRDNPAGSVYDQYAVTYTCWLRDRPKDGEGPKPVPLFDAACDHVGYVAANLAVRWHPDGDRVLYVSETEDRQHALFEYDLATKVSNRIFPHLARALIFDFTPDGSRLACVLGGTEEGRKDGIWVGMPGKNDWWHVSESQPLAKGELPSLLERLRATRPVWTRDGARFAFASTLAKQDPKGPDHHFLRLGLLAERRISTSAEGVEPFRDLHWAPDGNRLGLVCGGDPGSLKLTGDDGRLSKPVNRRPVRRFAGWSASGERLAYTVPDQLPYATEDQWAFLLLPDPLARDAVVIAPGSGAEPGREVFSGMRITFPSWSPNEEKLSLWFTFSPAHRFLLYRLFNAGLRPGDPAAVFDVIKGDIRWLAVNAYEKAQVGHYYLLKHNYAAAWERYQEAEREAPAKRSTQEEFLIRSPRDFSLFEYHCLKKLGREDEARAKLDLFHRTFLPEPSKDRQKVEGTSVPWDWLGGEDKFWIALLKDFYAAEVFLSLDAAEDARQFFQESLRTASTDAERLSSSLALAQVLLLEKKHVEYTELTTGTVAPLLMKLWKPGPLRLANEPRWMFLGHAALALMPLYSPQFLGGLPQERLQALVRPWTALREKAPDDVTRLGADLFLHAAYRALGREKERQEVSRHIEGNPAAAELLPKEGYEDLAKPLRQSLAVIP